MSPQTTLLSYDAPFPVCGLDWCNSPGPGHPLRPRSNFRLALGSFTEDYRNRLSIIGLTSERVLLEDEYDSGYGGQQAQPPPPDFTVLADAMHGYPATKVQWQPASVANQQWALSTASSELLATSGDALRVWEYIAADQDQKSGAYVGRHGDQRGELGQKLALSGAKASTPSSAPLTSFAWNNINPSLIVTASIDTTCTVWDISSSAAVTQLIAHDREVYDVAWLPGSLDIFTSVGADGSLRAFDLRSLEHSTILYETPAAKGSTSPARGPVTGLLRIAFNPNDSNYLATFHMDSSDVQVLDMRSPGQPVVEIKGHRGQVNAVGWGTQEGNMIATTGDDCQLLVWDLTPTVSPRHASGNRLSSPRPDSVKRHVLNDPILAYTAPSEINNLAWSPPTPGWTMSNGATVSSGEWVAIAMGRSIKALKV